MADFYLKSGAGAIVLANRVWASGEKMVPARADASSNFAVARKWVWECTTTGTSTGTPTWPASVTQDVTTVTQNGVVWTARKPGFSSGTTADWTFASIYMDYVATALAAGDRLFVSGNHNELPAGSITITFAGTIAAPNQVLCGNDAAAPPTALAATAVVASDGSGGSATMVINGSFYGYGIEFDSGIGAGNSANLILVNTGGNKQLYDNCTLRVGTTAGSSFLQIGTGGGAVGQCEFVNCKVRFAATGQKISSQCEFLWRGGSLHASSSAITLLADTNATRGGRVKIGGVDLSACAGAVNLASSSFQAPENLFLFRNCKLPTSWSGSLWSSAPTSSPGPRAELYNCDSADTNYRLWIEDYCGSIKQDTGVYASATDGTTPFSWVMATSASAKYPPHVLRSPELLLRNETTGAPKTLTVEIANNSATALNVHQRREGRRADERRSTDIVLRDVDRPRWHEHEAKPERHLHAARKRHVHRHGLRGEAEPNRLRRPGHHGELMTTVYQVPGAGYVQEVGTSVFQIPGYGYIQENQAAASFDAALMAAMNRPWRDIAFSIPQVVASGMTPPNQ